MRKKILYIITKSNFGGAQRYIYDLATHLPASDFEIAVAAGGTGEPHAPTGRLFSLLENKGVRTIPIHNFTRDIFILNDIRSLFELVSLINKERPDILHVTSSKAGGLGAFAGTLCGVKKIIFTSHGLAYDEDRSWIAKALIAIATWFTFLFVHTVIVISKNTEKRAKTLPFSAHKIIRIYNGIDPIETLPRAEAREHISSLTGKSLPPEPLIIGTISELTKNKGLIFLIDAMEKLRESAPTAHAIIIGDGEDRIELQEYIKKRNLQSAVTLGGYVSGAPKLLSGIDIFMLTSVKEGLPYVLLEAGSTGCAVIGSAIPGVTDIITHGQSGLLVPAKDTPGFARALEQLASNQKLRQELGENLRRSISSTFLLTHMIEETRKLYD